MSTLAILKQARKHQVAIRLQFRSMTVDDVPAAVEIIRQNYSDMDAALAMTEMRSAFNESKPQPVYFVAVIDQTIIGMIGVCDSFMDTRIYEIFWVNVLPEWQRTGVGKRLVKGALIHIFGTWSTTVLLTAKEDVLEFYRSLGFSILAPIEIGRSTDYLMISLRPDWVVEQWLLEQDNSH